jgi:hypothetical protein
MQSNCAYLPILKGFRDHRYGTSYCRFASMKPSSCCKSASAASIFNRADRYGLNLFADTLDTLDAHTFNL